MLKSGKAPDYRDRDFAIAKRSATVVGGLSRFEIIIKRVKLWIKDRLAVIEGLQEVRDEELWKEKYESWEECCFKEFGWQRSQAYSMLQAAEVVGELAESRILDSITTPSQALALVPVKESKREAVVDRAMKSGEPLTAKRISAAIKPSERKRKPQPKVIDVQSEPKPKKRVHDCPSCRCNL